MAQWIDEWYFLFVHRVSAPSLGTAVYINAMQLFEMTPLFLLNY